MDGPVQPRLRPLADPTRRAILTRLRKGDATVGELPARFTHAAPSGLAGIETE